MPLPSLKTIEWVTTDCYGSLIDWEKGILESFKAEAESDGFSFEEKPFLDRFFEVQAEIMAGSYELYAEVLRRTAVKVAGEVGWEIEPSRAQFLPDSVVDRGGVAPLGRRDAVLGEQLLALVLE